VVFVSQQFHLFLFLLPPDHARKPAVCFSLVRTGDRGHDLFAVVWCSTSPSTMFFAFVLPPDLLSVFLVQIPVDNIPLGGVDWYHDQLSLFLSILFNISPPLSNYPTIQSSPLSRTLALGLVLAWGWGQKLFIAAPTSPPSQARSIPPLFADRGKKSPV